MKAIEELEQKIVDINTWHNSYQNITLLFTQKKGLEFLINHINSNAKQKQLRKALKDLMLELLKNGTLNQMMQGVSGNEDEIENIINEISGSGSNNNISPIKFSITNWKVYKSTIFNSTENPSLIALDALTSLIDQIANLLIGLFDYPGRELQKEWPKLSERLSTFLAKISKNIEMTFNEETKKIFEEMGILLIEKCDIDPVSNENGVIIKNVEYKDDWELFLWWAISKNKFCRCILQGSYKNVSIIGKENNVNEVFALYEFKSNEIMNNSVDKAIRQVLWDLNSLNSKGKHDLNAFNEIKSRKDGYIKDNLLWAIDAELSDILLAEKMNNNDSGVDAFISSKFPNLGYMPFNIAADLGKNQIQFLAP